MPRSVEVILSPLLSSALPFLQAGLQVGGLSAPFQVDIINLILLCWQSSRRQSVGCCPKAAHRCGWVRNFCTFAKIPHTQSSTVFRGTPVASALLLASRASTFALQCRSRWASAAVSAPRQNMHPDTCAALRLLVLALTAHPEDIATLAIYGDMPEHLTDVIADYVDDGDED